MYFDFELEVYQDALDFVVTEDEVAHKLPRDRRYLKDQLLRAANSIAATPEPKAEGRPEGGWVVGRQLPKGVGTGGRAEPTSRRV